MAKSTLTKTSKATVIKIAVIIVLPVLLITVAFYLYRQYFYHNRFINKVLLKKDMEFEFFTYDEFDSKATATDIANGLEWYMKKGSKYIKDSGLNHVNKDSILMLDKARKDIEENWNSINGNKKIYFVINSAYRSDTHNEAVGGVVNSAHRDKVDGSHAFDISWSNYQGTERNAIEQALRNAGFNRVGTYSSFIHVDNDNMLPSPANW